jgi:hypothetical protein
MKQRPTRPAKRDKTELFVKVMLETLDTPAWRALSHGARSLYIALIVLTRPGFLGIEGKGKAPHWRLTELAYKNDPPSREFMNWNGVPFQAQKTRVSWKSGTVVSWRSVTPKNKTLS